MKQLNQKTGGEHIRVNLPKPVVEGPTMVIGIDVCHAGKSSIVGFAASTNKACTSYFSDFIIQPKNQEIVKSQLDSCMTRALNAFNNNVGQLPTKIVVYRDGVGEGMRPLIENKELGQMREVVKQIYNQLS